MLYCNIEIYCVIWPLYMHIFRTDKRPELEQIYVIRANIFPAWESNPRPTTLKHL